MPVINARAVADTYPDQGNSSGAIISEVFNSRGGWFSVASAAVFVELQYGPHASSYWTEEVEVGVGAFAYLDAKCTGLRFRNAVAGQAATVTAQIAQGDEPPLSIVALGTISVATVANVTRTIFTAGLQVPYTLPNGCKVILVECVGSGGGGGGVNVALAGQVAVAGGGGGGSYAAKLIPVSSFTSPSTLNVSVGSGGSGGVGNAAGGAGDVSNLDESGGAGFWVQAKGGAGGSGAANAAAPMWTPGGAGGGGITGPNIGDIIVIGGGGGFGLSLTAGVSAHGGDGGAGAVYGAPQAGNSGLAFTGFAGQAFGGGGTGAGRTSSTGSQTGGLGHDGLVVITEFY